MVYLRHSRDQYLKVLTLAACLSYYLLVVRNKKKKQQKKVILPKEDTVKKLVSSTSLSYISQPLSAPLWKVDVCGFLPSRPPREAPADDRLSILSEIVEMLPSLTLHEDERLLQLIQSRDAVLKTAVIAIKEATEEDELECVHGLYSYLIGGLIKTNVTKIPESIAQGFKLCADRIHRGPMLDYAGCVLYNWGLIDPKGPVTINNVRMLRRFTGLIDEEWFFKTHLVLEAAAGDAVMAIKDGISRFDALSPSLLLELLRKIEISLGTVVRDCLPLMFERRPHHGALCDYYFFFHRLRPFMSGYKDITFAGVYNNYPQTFPGPSGAMSTLLPCLDAFLGVQNSSTKLAQLLKEFSASMPLPHRNFLNQVSSQSLSVRALVLQARKDGKSQDIDIVEALATQFDRCIDLLLDFRWRHLQMVRKYVVEPSGGDASSVTGTGGTSALEYLHEHIADTEAAKLPAAGESWFFSGNSFDSSTTLTELPRVSIEPEISGLEHDDFWRVDGTHGLLPNRSPVLPLTQDFENIESLAIRLPFLCAGRRLRAVVDTLELLPLEKIEILSIDQLEALRVRLAFIAAAYQRADLATCATTTIHGDLPLPHNFKKVYDAVADRLDRPKRLCFSDLVLCNLVRMTPLASKSTKVIKKKSASNICPYAPPNKAKDEHEVIQQESLAVKATCTFLAVPEEVSLLSTLFQTEVSSPEIIAAITTASKNPKALTDCLQALRTSLRDAALRHDTEATRSSRADKATMRRLRNFLLPANSSDIDLALILYSGDSVLLPIVWRFLGIPKAKGPGAADLQRARDTLLHSRAPPKAHRDFLQNITSIRNDVVRFCESNHPVHHIARLEAAYNDCIDELLRLSSRRSQLVCRYLPHFASDFRNNHFDLDRRALQAARLSLLLDRRLNQRRSLKEASTRSSSFSED